jgi:hypothetical protein
MPDVALYLNDRGVGVRSGSDWAAPAVGKIIRNRLYVGDFVVGKVSEFVPEYQILSEGEFETAQAVRTRFQKPDSAARPTMPKKRKESRINRICVDYIDFLNHDERVKNQP